MAATASSLDRMLDPMSRILTPEVARRLLEFRVDPQIEARLDYLSDRSTEGKLTPEERSEYEALVSAGTVISILRAKARKLLSENLT